MKTACLPQLWVSCVGKGLGCVVIQVWARCVPFAVRHACMCRVFCDAFPLDHTKKQVTHPNSLGAILNYEFEDASPVRALFLLFLWEGNPAAGRFLFRLGVETHREVGCLV